MKDSLCRTINYLRVSVTDLCNLRCLYCMPPEGVCKKQRDEILTLEEIERTVEAAVGLGVTKVRITGGEPLVRGGIVELTKRIAHMPGVTDVSMTTNGILLPQYAGALKEAGLKRINISLDTLKADKYHKITGGGQFNDALAGIRAALAAELQPIKINTVLMKGFNDDEIEALAQLTMDNDIEIRFIELMPIGEAGHFTEGRFLGNDEVLRRLPLQELKNPDPHGPARLYKLPGAKGRVGLINPVSHKFCDVCNRLRLTADGKLKPCLLTDDEVDIKSILREQNGAGLEEAIREAVRLKPKENKVCCGNFAPIKRDMNRIGG